MIKTGSDFLIGPGVVTNGLVDALGTRHRSVPFKRLS